MRKALGTLVVFGLLLFGCSEKIVEKAIEAGTKGSVKIDTKKGQVDIKTDEGNITAGTGKVPDGWPDDVPIYKGAKVVTGGTTNDAASGKAMMVTLESSDDADKVTNFYKDKLPGEGWTIESDYSGNGGGGTGNSLSAKKDNRQVNLIVSGDGSKTAVVITVTEKS